MERYRTRSTDRIGLGAAAVAMRGDIGLELRGDFAREACVLDIDSNISLNGNVLTEEIELTISAPGAICGTPAESRVRHLAASIPDEYPSNATTRFPVRRRIVWGGGEDSVVEPL